MLQIEGGMYAFIYALFLQFICTITTSYIGAIQFQLGSNILIELSWAQQHIGSWNFDFQIFLNLLLFISFL